MLVFPQVTNLASQHRAVIREKLLLTLWCIPEANKQGTSLHQAVALCGASLLKGTQLPQLYLQGIHCMQSQHLVLNTALPSPMGVGAGREGLVSSAGAGSPTQAGMSAPREVSVHPLGTISQAGDSVGMTDSPQETEGCSSIEGAVGGVTSTAHNSLYSAPPYRHPVGQPIVFGDLGSGAVTANLGRRAVCPTCSACLLQFMLGQCRLGHLTPLQCMAAVCARSAPAARVIKIGSETALRDQRLANYEARLRQEGSVSPVPNPMVDASVPHGVGHSQFTQGQTAPVTHSK